MIVLSYLWPLALVPLLVEKEDAEIQWHAKHGIVLMVAGADVAISATVVYGDIVLVEVLHEMGERLQTSDCLPPRLCAGAKTAGGRWTEGRVGSGQRTPCTRACCFVHESSTA